MQAYRRGEMRIRRGPIEGSRDGALENKVRADDDNDSRHRSSCGRRELPALRRRVFDRTMRLLHPDITRKRNTSIGLYLGGVARARRNSAVILTRSERTGKPPPRYRPEIFRARQIGR